MIVSSLAGLSGLRLVAGWRACRVSPPLFLRARPVSVGRVGEVFAFAFRAGYSGLT